MVKNSSIPKIPLHKDKKEHVVYGLAYDKSGLQKFFYVGVTKQPERRYYRHMSGSSGNMPKDDIIKALKDKGDKIEMVILRDGLTEKEAYKEEKYWIRRLWRENHKLANRTTGGKFPAKARRASRMAKKR